VRRRARESVTVNPERNDAFSREFEDAYRAVLESIKGDL